MATKYEYRVSGIPDAPIIDNNGNIRPSSVWGNTYFVDYENGSASNNGLSKNNAVKLLSTAIGKVTNNNWDLIVGDPYSEVVETSMVTNTANRFNVVGDTSGRILGPRFRVSATILTGATNIATMQNTGVGVGFHGIKFSNASTVAEGKYSVAEGGEYAVYRNCEFYKSTDLDETAAAELLHNGDSAQFFNCSFGSTANIVADNKIRPNVLLSRETITGKVCRDSIFEDCYFLSKAGGTEHVAVYGSGATDVERMLTFKRCAFINNVLSAATPSVAVSMGAAQTEGQIVLDPQCFVVDFGVMATTGQNIFVSTPSSPTYATSGLSVAS